MAQWKAQVGDLAGGIEQSHPQLLARFVPLLRHSGLTEQIMTWNIFLVSGDIINVVVLDAALASPSGDSWLGAAGCHCDSTSGSPALFCP